MFPISATFCATLALSACLNVASAKEHTVTFSDSPIWTVGFGVAYADVSITVGDALAFVSYSGHDVALVHAPLSGTHWDQCGSNGIGASNNTKIFAANDFTAVLSTKHYTPPTCGDFYIACSVGPHCMYGQRVKVVVKSADGKACASPCVNAGCVTSASKSLKSGATEYGVKPMANSKWWGTGPYDALEVNLGDTVLFRTGAGFHDVATVPTKAGFDACSMTGKTVVGDWTYGTIAVSSTCKSASDCCVGATCGVSGNYVTYAFNASAAGDTYFVCSIGNGGHCKTGQKLHVKVLDGATSHARPAIAASLWAICIAWFLSAPLLMD